ncbi:hypothetical protein E4U54_008311 [Claviceps lovelessii]|nr:hypothetical protein E4U54_008311 [Claviceps lovelessii]
MSNSPNLALPHRRDVQFFQPTTSQEGINEGTWGLDRAALQHGQDDSDEERDGREDEHAVKANSHTHEYDE